MKKVLSIFISFMLVFSLVPVTMASESLSDDIVILYTNDVHTYIDGNLSYDVIAAIKDELEKEYKYVFLADAGDHIQGTAYGSMDKGKSIIELMNAADYDVATLGNHEFDYGTEGCFKTIERAGFPYLSANFYHEKNGVRKDNVLDSYKIFPCGDEKLAFVGITTPETFTKSTPAYFQDENGDFIYGISGGNDGALLQNDVQKAIDEAKKQGATKVIGLGHLGVDPSSGPWTSEETIGATCGMNAFIDGHSHTVVEGKAVKDKDGHDVLLTQTGEYFTRIGMMVIDSETDNITTDFIECEEILAPDGKTVTGYALKSDLYTGKEVVSSGEVKEIKDNWISQIDEKLGEKIGSTELVLDNYDADGNRLVRSEETNSGDFAADALYYLFDNMDIDVDVAVMNGGGIRNFGITGDISYKICKDMHTFGNVACLQTISGQQLLDALEWGSRLVGVGEEGSFLQVSGIKYKIDPSVPTTVKGDDMGTWIAGPENYRVYDVKVYNKEKMKYDPLDLNEKYNLAGYNYTLRDLGGGFAMFEGAVNVLDYVMEDYMVLANYVKGFENCEVKATNSPLSSKYPGFVLNYATVNGSGRIKIAEKTRGTYEDEIYVGGIKVTADNEGDVLDDGGSVKYDSVSDTLVLTDATITNDKGHGIYARGVNLTIYGVDTEKEGNNSISGNCVVTEGIDEDGSEYTVTEPGSGIFVEGNGENGNGTLKIMGVLGDITGMEGSGISAYEDIKISGAIGSINCTGGISNGISSDFGSVIVDKKSKIKSINSEYNGIGAAENVTIEGSIGSIYGGGYSGIHATGGEVNISGKFESIIGLISGIESYAVLSEDEEGRDTYSGGDVILKCTDGIISGGDMGIYADGKLYVDGKVTVKATNENTEERYAVSVGGDIVLVGGQKTISEPFDSKTDYYVAQTIEAGEEELEVLRSTVFSGEGAVAHIVKFDGYVNPFKDIFEEDLSAVRFMHENGYMVGISENEFGASEYFTRAMIVTILYRLEGEPVIDRSIPFDDVDMGAYYANAVSWAKQNGIVYGVTETKFKPDSEVIRQDLATILHRYAIFKGYDLTGEENMDILSYVDFDKISGYAIEGVKFVSENKIMDSHIPDAFSPKGFMQRRAVAHTFYRFANILYKSDTVNK